MTGRAGEDASVAVEGRLNHHWLSLLQTREGREQAGVKYLSLGHAELPFWSVWLSEAPGVYRLELVGARATGAEAWLAEFKLKYYPAPDEACFAGLSIYEQACRRGPAFGGRPATRGAGEGGCPCHGGGEDTPHEERFADLVDGTGAPDPAHQERLPGDFFLAGGLLLAFCERGGTRIRWQSQDRWRVRLTSGCSVLGADGRSFLTRRKGELDRDYPGFLLTDRMARRFLGGWCRFHGYGLRREKRSERRGTEYLSDGRALVPAPDPTTRQIAVEVDCRRLEGDALPPLA